jgi:acetolactate synthase-1/2/3 large subunit
VDRSEINKVKSVRWSHVGLLPEALRQLQAAVLRAARQRDYQSWHAHVAALKQRYGMNYQRTGELVQPQYVIEEINRHTRGEAIITTGVGQHQMWAAQMFDFGARVAGSPRAAWARWASVAGAIGAQVANPGRLVIDVDGDASIRITLASWRP